jgi:hypothetical protein
MIFIHMFNRYDNADKHTGTMEPGLIPVLHYVAEAKALVESDGAEKKDDHDGIFHIQDRLVEEDPLTSTSSSYLHPQLEVKVTLMGVSFAPNHSLQKKSASTHHHVPHWGKTLQLLPLYKVVCQVISSAESFTSSL